MKNQKSIKVGNVEMPLEDFVVSRDAILGITKSGKTFTAKGIAEQLMENGIPIIVFDAIGMWRFLKVPSGKSGGKGFPIVVAGGAQPDLPLTPATAPQIVRAAIQQNISLVIDLYDPKLSKADWRRIVQDCFRILLFENKGLRKIFLEEAAEYCLDKETDVLTKNGWKKICDITIYDSVSSLNLITGDYEWNSVLRIIRKDFNGEMIRVKSKTVDCLMTPDHRAVIRRFQHDPERYKIYPPVLCEASKLPMSFLIPFGGIKSGTGMDISDDTIRAIGWIATDGSRHSTGRPYICVSQSKLVTREKMRLVLGRLGATENKRNRGERFIANNKHRSKTIETSTFFLGKKPMEIIGPWLVEDIHRINRKLLTNLNEGQLRLLLESLLEGDGGIDNGEWRFFYPGNSEGLADDFQEICLRLNIRTIKVFRDNQWKVSIATKKKDCWISHKNQITKEDYSGEVFCLTVENGTFVARRNGRTFVTGNCPQKIMDGQTYAEVEKLARMGGNASLGITFINPRAQELNKSVLELCDNIILLRQRGKHAIDSLEKQIDKLSPDMAKEIALTMPKMTQGDCWVFTENGDEPTRTRSDQIKSFHPDRRNPDANRIMQAAVNTDDFVQALSGKLEKVIEEAKANDPKELKRKLAHAEKEIKRLESAKPVQAKLSATPAKTVPALTDFDRKYLSKRLLELESISIQIRKSGDKAEASATEVRTLLEKVIQKIAPAKPLPPIQSSVIKRIAPPTTVFKVRESSSHPESNGEPGKGARQILIAAAQNPDGVTDEQIAVLTGYKKTSRTTYKQQLKSIGYLVDGGRGYQATQEGIAWLGDDYNPLPTGDALREHWMRNLPQGELALFKVYVENYPNDVSLDAMMEATGYQKTSVTTYRQKLSARNLISGHRASENLFD